MPRKRGESWSEDNMEAALKALTRGKLSQRAVSEKYNIPRRTLRNHMLTGSSLKRFGRKSTLSPQQEHDLVQRIKKLSDIGMPLTIKMLKFQVYKFCSLHNIPNMFNKSKGSAGRTWLKAFLNRNTDISKRKAQFMNEARAQKLNKFIVKDHFDKFNQLVNELGIKNSPERIFNMDEKNCRLTLHHQPTVLAAKGAKRVHCIANEHAQSVTVVGCVSAVGIAIPPMVIFKGKRQKPEFTDNLPPGSLVKMAPKGYMNTELFIVFLEHLAKYKPSGKILLIFDGAKCHLDFTIVDAGEKLGIDMYCLPSNTTHELQPLDKAVYRSFEYYWDQEFLKYKDLHPDRRFNKVSFNSVLTEVWSKCMTQSNIRSGFAATGLYPFNPEVIPESAYAPSVLSERPVVDSQNRPVETISDDDDDIPLSQLVSARKENMPAPTKSPFQKLMPTPTPKAPKPVISQRRKAINYQAQRVTKALFLKSNPSSSGTAIASSSTTELIADNASWYCVACQEDRMADMRQCRKCFTWYHELCVGLTPDDEDFYCCH